MESGAIGIVAVGGLLLLARLAWPRAMDSAADPWLLTVASLAIVAWWQPFGLLVTLLLLGITVTHLSLTRRSVGRSPLLQAGTILLLMAPLVFFKYVPWLLSTWSSSPGPSSVAWALPVGLSFTTFRLIGVVMDSRSLNARPSPLHVAFLTLFFPTYQAGPITTLQNFGPIAEGTSSRSSMFWAAERILRGLVRKVVLADPLHALLITPWLAAGAGGLAPYQALVLPVLLGFYIYWDFAGYTDIAVGTGRILGYRVPENFDRPYLSPSIVDFWRRWHITLSEWIRLRVMMKLVGRRSPTSHMYAATVVSMALCGLWHGAGWNFIFWGTWHGLGLVAAHLFGQAQRVRPALFDLCQSPFWNAAAVVITFVFVMAGWVFFFLPLNEAWAMISRMSEYRLEAGPALAVPLSLITLLVAGYVGRDVPASIWARLPSPVRGTAVSAMLAIVTYLLIFSGMGTSEFVYSQF